MIATREICAICGHVVRVGFWVPNEIWLQTVHLHWQNSILCLDCFTTRADEKLIDWSEKIKFYPVSFKAHLTPDWTPKLQSKS